MKVTEKDREAARLKAADDILREMPKDWPSRGFWQKAWKKRKEQP